MKKIKLGIHCTKDLSDAHTKCSASKHFSTGPPAWDKYIYIYICVQKCMLAAAALVQRPAWRLQFIYTCAHLCASTEQLLWHPECVAPAKIQKKAVSVQRDRAGASDATQSLITLTYPTANLLHACWRERS